MGSAHPRGHGCAVCVYIYIYLFIFINVSQMHMSQTAAKAVSDVICFKCHLLAWSVNERPVLQVCLKAETEAEGVTEGELVSVCVSFRHLRRAGGGRGGKKKNQSIYSLTLARYLCSVMGSRGGTWTSTDEPGQTRHRHRCFSFLPHS